MAIKVSGSLKLRGFYQVELDMTEEEFDALPAYKQNHEIENAIDWDEWTRNSELDDIDVDDIQ
jgi:hypothetical protein